MTSPDVICQATSITLGNLNLKDGYIKVMGKGAKERVVPIGEYIKVILWSYIDNVRPKLTTQNCDNLFLSYDSKPITVNTVKLIFSRLAKKAGIRVPFTKAYYVVKEWC